MDVMPYVIALWHQKGGVAKTTTATSLAACLVEKHHETLVVDLDVQANLTAGLGADPSKVRYSVADVLMGNASLLSISRETSLPGLDLVGANPSLLTVARYLHVRENYEYLLRETFAQPALAHYDFIVLDCPPQVGPVTITALTAANLVIAPTQCEYFSVQALRQTLDLVELVRHKTNPALAYRILVTMFDLRGTLHRRLLDQLRTHFAGALLNTIVGFDSKLRESQLAGTPITLHSPASRSVNHYRQLAEEMLAYVQQPVL
jgi:chromosome partitioning protein